MKTLIVIIGIAMLISTVILSAIPSVSIAASAQVSGVIIGKSVRAENGVVLGKVVNIVLTDNGCVRYVILSGQFHNARGRLYPLPWRVIARTEREAIFVNVDPKVLVEAPNFREGRWPDFAQAQWNTRVTEFFRSHVHANTPAGAGDKERLKAREEHKSRENTSRWKNSQPRNLLFLAKRK